ncbi:anti-anti-sigma factor [Metabacillus crassostreae]|uniref:STAS domain-containing protein n=1 Tax=Metabacillus crassostreae TaxID=929098 RepID=UPI0019576649|nr:STAS domain-containing protein [Metabacillus crassostreae]MBM7605917.1 anti-anti-sigma factor [Metabacillus crassostreae]
MNPTIKINQFDGNQLFVIEGKLSYGRTQPIKEVLIEAIDHESPAYVFDLTELKAIDSTGMGLFVTFLKYIENEKKVHLIIQKGFIKELFHIAKLDQLFIISDNIEDCKGENG